MLFINNQKGNSTSVKHHTGLRAPDTGILALTMDWVDGGLTLVDSTYQGFTKGSPRVHKRFWVVGKWAIEMF